MHSHRVSRVLPYTPEQMFDLVGGVQAYPEFVPWITSMSVGPERSEAEGVSVVDAQASVGFSFLKERFSTWVRRDAPRREITVGLISGPFRKLRNAWSFRPHALGCEVVFEIEFEFKARLLDRLLASNFDRAVNKLIACFQARAERLYGRPPSAAAARA